MSNKDKLTGSNGKCPVCGSLDLRYFDLDVGENGDNIYWEFSCNNCGQTGKEWWELKNGQTVVQKDNLNFTQEEIDNLRDEIRV